MCETRTNAVERLLGLACSAALMLLVATPITAIHAQQPGAQQPEGVLFGEIPVVSGASRYEQVADEAPASVTVITSEEIARQGWRTLAELLQSVRGFYTSYDRNYTYLGVRGFGQPGDFNTRALLLLDGQRINENVGGGVLLGTESPVELELVERVEVIRGPGSSLYGTGAFFAVVNVVTKRGRAFQAGEVATSIQSFGGKQGRLSLGTRFRSGLEVLASGTLFRSAGQDLYYPELNDSSTNFGRAVNMDRDRRDHALLKVTQGALTLVSNYSSREKRIPTATFGTTFNDPAERTHDDELMLALQFSPLVGERGQLHTALSYNSKTFDGYYPVTGGLGHNYSSGRWWIAEGNYAVRLGRAHQMVLGGEYQLNARQSQGIADALSGTTYFSDNTRADNWGVFGQDEIRLTPRVLVNAGLRYDHYASFGGTLNPRLALIYHHAGSAVKLLAGRAFRAPNNNEQYFAISQAQKTNPNLTPEEIWSYEGVVDHQLGRRWRVSLSAYQNRIRRLITLEIDPADSLRVFRNVGSVDARGFEIETGGDLGGLDLRLSYGLQRTRYPGTATKLANSPQHLGKVDISHALLHEHLTVGGEMLAVSRRIASNGGPVPGHAVFNLTLRSQQWPARVSAGLAVYNLLGTRYSDPASKDQIQTAIPQDGRSLRATLQFGF